MLLFAVEFEQSGLCWQACPSLARHLERVGCGEAEWIISGDSPAGAGRAGMEAGTGNDQRGDNPEGKELRKERMALGMVI